MPKTQRRNKPQVEVHDAHAELTRVLKEKAVLERQLKVIKHRRERVMQTGGKGWVRALAELDMAFDRAMHGLVSGLRELEDLRRRFQ